MVCASGRLDIVEARWCNLNVRLLDIEAYAIALPCWVHARWKPFEVFDYGHSVHFVAEDDVHIVKMSISRRFL